MFLKTLTILLLKIKSTIYIIAKQKYVELKSNGRDLIFVLPAKVARNMFTLFPDKVPKMYEVRVTYLSRVWDTARGISRNDNIGVV